MWPIVQLPRGNLAIWHMAMATIELKPPRFEPQTSWLEVKALAKAPTIQVG